MYKEEVGKNNALIPEERVDRIEIVELYSKDTGTRKSTALVDHPVIRLE